MMGATSYRLPASLLWAVGDDAGFRIVDGDVHARECVAGGTVDIDFSLFIGRLGGIQSRFGDGQSVGGCQSISARLRSELLFLLGDIEGALGQVARFLCCVDASLCLFERELRVPHIEADALLLLFRGDLALPVLEHRSELVGLDLPVTQIYV